MKHVQAYRDSHGADGDEWQPGVYTLLLTTTGRKSGNAYTTPLIYGEDGDDYVVVASKGARKSIPTGIETSKHDQR